MKKLIEIHIIQNFSPSNLNRDDTGAPKDAFFGGTTRARISSQCLKHSVRKYFSLMLKEGKLSELEIGIRTKKILEKVVSQLVDRNKPQEEANKKASIFLTEYFSKALFSKKLFSQDNPTKCLLFLEEEEIESIVDNIYNDWDEIAKSPETDSKSDKKNKKSKKDRIDINGKSIDIALFGRMLTDRPDMNQYASCQVAHAISTHKVEREFDYFTAIDDLSDQTSGSAMIGTTEFNSACFYRYANVDVNKLTENLQNNSELAIAAICAFIEAYTMATPAGKQNSFAAHNPPELVIVSVGSNVAPWNLANAFETAIYTKSNESRMAKSAEELVKKAKSLNNAYGGERKNFILNLTEANLNGFGTVVKSLQEILDKAIESLRE